MIHLIKLIFSLIISYLLGSLPTAYIFGRLYKKIDIREHGSGNMGATNAFRVLGKIPGILVLLIDIAKGTIATTLIGDLFGLNQVIKGWTEGLQLMSVGSKFRFTIPPHLAYGEQEVSKEIGPNSTLVFDVELLEIN